MSGKTGLKKKVKFVGLMRWVEPNQQWFLYNAKSEDFIMNFFDCANIKRVFPKMKKDKDNLYELNIKLVNE
ncbi:MAG: hypothetical protein JXD21_05905 [Candidatus Omnitrophica bacterium]|nr:hypothetical protein [Candidatus Omnitrophota bacterium]